MDPVTMGAVLAAVAGGAGGALGSQVWDGICTLVRRPFRHHAAGGETGAAVVSGEAALGVLKQHPTDARTATALAEALLIRAETDSEFKRELAAWWDRARQIEIGDRVSNTVSGGTQFGPVLQGRDFTGVNFGIQAGTTPQK